ncbi:hypothetical protein HOC80_01075 [archaeon]|jgi:ssDNA-binding replication factor A large subunit|nr:hypothetical protein [archaeon]
MKINELKQNQRGVTIELNITDFGDLRKFYKFGTEGRVITALGKDETGKICVTLWNKEIDQIKIGDKIKVTNGYVNLFQGIMQITAGRYGKVEVIGESDQEEISPSP